MTGTVVTHKTQVGQSNTAANNFTIRTLDDGSLRVSRGNAGAETSDVLVIDANGNFSTAPVLGVGQTWQNVTASRAASTTYTNTTGRPIQVMITVNWSDNTDNFNFFVDGVAVLLDMEGGVVLWSSPVAVIVPAGSTYSITANYATPIKRWMELR